MQSWKGVRSVFSRMTRATLLLLAAMLGSSVSDNVSMLDEKYHSFWPVNDAIFHEKGNWLGRRTNTGRKEKFHDAKFYVLLAYGFAKKVFEKQRRIRAHISLQVLVCIENSIQLVYFPVSEGSVSDRVATLQNVCVHAMICVLRLSCNK